MQGLFLGGSMGWFPFEFVCNMATQLSAINVPALLD
jgi:hypothetical protein